MKFTPTDSSASYDRTLTDSVVPEISKYPLQFSVAVEDKTYDGTKNADISSVTFEGSVTLQKDKDYTVTASFDDASVGNGKNVTATVTLMGQTEKNYALKQSSITTTGNITKAAVPDFTKETALTIVNDHEKTYTVTLPTLPVPEAPKEYGTVTYGAPTVNLSSTYYTGGAKVEDGKLILPIQKNDVKTTGSVGTATVVIKSANYEDITLTVNVNATNKLVPTVTAPTANALTYNGAEQALVTAGKTTGGTMLYRLGDSEWSEQIPTAKNAGEYTVWYKVQGDAEYADVAEQNVTVTAAKKAVTVTTLDKRAYTGSTTPDLSSPEADKDYKVEGLVGADTLSGTVTLAYAQTPDMSKTGETAINITGTLSNNNYEITYVSGKLTVSKQPSSGGGSSSGGSGSGGGSSSGGSGNSGNSGNTSQPDTGKPDKQDAKKNGTTENGNQNQKPQPDTDNGKDNGTSIKPYIKDDSGKEGWDVIKPQLEEAKSGDTVTVAMNGTTVVPKDVIDSIKGKDTTLVLDMGNGLSWKIYGKDITDAAGDIDFDVTVGADAGKSIPVDVINNVTGEHSSLNLTLAYDGEFGFTATLTVNMESKNAGLYANLFYYNEQTGELEFISAGQIDSDGNVELVFTHASDYTIVVDTKIMSDNGQADNKADETIPAPKTDDSTSKYAWNNTIIVIIGICIILIVTGAIFYVRKKSGLEEE